ncbi:PLASMODESMATA CALLOSE-BINDING PROTEIN 3-like [Zingiber officinale]|uniref:PLASMODESMATA CALLOSE-BINDING PROTEIN 3-like n=1 Tax=Zingiber officinale TaxID=94328 RepID=UPI001C4D2A3E|nr:PLASMODESMATA CALLOSE-BINDING PROTEIN 3-like [Zingiber officinale]
MRRWAVVMAAAVAVTGILMISSSSSRSGVASAAATWCIARSGAGAKALQTALDYACGSGVADCAPVQPSGLCYLPNSLAAHASYAFNSYYQRSNAAPGACDFADTATVTVTDPSYGSCTYPSSARTAGGSTNAPSTNTAPGTPATTLAPPTLGGTDGEVDGLGPPGFDSTVPNVDMSFVYPFLPILITILSISIFSTLMY